MRGARASCHPHSNRGGAAPPGHAAAAAERGGPELLAPRVTLPWRSRRPFALVPPLTRREGSPAGLGRRAERPLAGKGDAARAQAARNAWRGRPRGPRGPEDGAELQLLQQRGRSRSHRVIVMTLTDACKLLSKAEGIKLKIRRKLRYLLLPVACLVLPHQQNLTRKPPQNQLQAQRAPACCDEPGFEQPRVASRARRCRAPGSEAACLPCGQQQHARRPVGRTSFKHRKPQAQMGVS